MLVIPIGASLARLSQGVCKGLARRGSRTALGGDDECAEARRHAKAQHALDEDAHGLDVHPSDHGVGPGRAVKADDEVVLAPDHLLQLLALRLQLLVPLLAVLKVPGEVTPLAALLLEGLRRVPEQDNPPQGIALLVVEALKLSGRHGDNILREGLVGVQELLLRAAREDDGDCGEVVCHDEVVVRFAGLLDDVRRKHIHEVSVREIGSVLLCEVALLRLELVVLRSLVPSLLVKLVHDAHQECQVLRDGAGLRVLGLVPLPGPEIIRQIPLLALGLDLEVRLCVELKELALQPVYDAVNLRVGLGKVIGQADEVVERAKEQRALAVRHVEHPRAPVSGQRRGMLQLGQEAALLHLGAVRTLPPRAAAGNNPKLLAGAHPWNRRSRH
mmetsp:Transcript_25152/g.79902  ORF Transcript_25152/g.79902 Transcript_25152/m.79902 type:complete len:387 (-) Transcript_25152:46-1206(-)